MTDFTKQTIILENHRARLEPLEEKHFIPLWEIAKQEELWEFTTAKINSEAAFRRYVDTALQEMKDGLSYVWAIFDKEQNKYGGCTRYGNISLLHKRVEIGWTWYDPSLQRTGLNRNCKLLLLSYGFEELQLNRIELRTSHLNLKSQKAIEGIGATKEGILRQHMIAENGFVRDTVYFGMIKQEWPEIKERIFNK
ncbi:GNAT family N-acetyltransferase [Ferruginibacter sp. HRS2-29]|uniref:GNAT family N-acetyltransferase n=1 Tax=Ferruginibacter sp. HRS2-29 TaxID=2487334 RepID=UPI0020CE9867|nr:GNAT family protein [Ferruginibacter sp. HRS2-29]